MQTNILNDNSDNISFQIGKAYGLAGKKYLFNTYRNTLNKIDDDLERIKQKEFDAFNGKINSVLIILSNYQNQIKQNIKDTITNTNICFTELEKLYNASITHDGYTKAKAKELYDLVFDQVKTFNTNEIKLSGDLRNQISIIQTSFETMQNSLIEKHNEYLDELRKNKVSFQLIEEGYRHGESLRYSMTDRSDDVQGIFRNAFDSIKQPFSDLQRWLKKFRQKN